MPIVIPIAWGIAILMAAGASALALRQYQDEELELGRIELPDYLRGKPDPLPEPEPERPTRQRPHNQALRRALEEMIRTQARRKRDCEDSESEDCPYCKPAVDGHPTVPWHIFEAGPVRKPSPRARGALYQHFVIPWFGFFAEDKGGKLTIHIEEWDWKRGRDGSWDGLHHAECKLIECKLGYRDFLDERLIGGAAHTTRNPKKPWLPSLKEAWEGQLREQHAAFDPDWPGVTLQWVLSDDDVRWQLLYILNDLGLFNIDTKHVPYDLAPTGTNFVNELYRSGEQDYGYWEDN